MWTVFDVVLLAAGLRRLDLFVADDKNLDQWSERRGRQSSPESRTARNKPPEPVMLPKWRVDGFIVVAACAPVVGIVMAIYSREPAWLFLCFALTLFL